MMMLVIGGSGSGKSLYAEETAVRLAQERADEVGKRKKTLFSNCKHRAMKKYYIATMRVFDKEGKKRVKRHRRLRRGKGFRTIEQPARLSGALEKMEEGERTVLLECVSNLTANEMFAEEETKAERQTVESVIRDIRMLKEQTTHIVVVSNNVFEDGTIYEETTMAYIQAMGKINQKLALLADRVVEVAAGIPIRIK